MDTDPVAVLRRNKADILQRLVSLSRDPQQAQALLTDLSRIYRDGWGGHLALATAPGPVRFDFNAACLAC